MKPPTKIFFLAIDAGDKLLIRNWANDGTLPNISALMNRGLVCETMSVDGFYEGSTWPSFYTGVNPARHGFHRLTQLAPGTYDFCRCDPGGCITREPFWNTLSRAGKKVAVLDIPLASVSKNLNGIHMVEWGGHDAAYGFKTWPPGLRLDVLRRFGTHPVRSSCDSYGKSPRDFCMFKEFLIEGVRKKTALTLHYMRECNWDFFGQVFTEAHCVGHQCWHLHDPTHPNYDRNTVAITGDPIEQVYRAIDSAIGQIVAQVSEDTILFLLCSHRMNHNIGAAFLLENILEKTGYLKLNPPGFEPPPKSIVNRIGSFGRGQWLRIPYGIRQTLKPLLFPLYQQAMLGRSALEYRMSASIDTQLSQCFSHENGNIVSGIRINLQGREPAGIVRPGEELEVLCRRISEDLLAIRYKDSGKSAIMAVLRTSDLFRGEHVENLPDLLVFWEENQLIGSKGLHSGNPSSVQLTSERIGTIEGDYTYGRTGDHRPEGLCIVVGHGIKKGSIARIVSIMDFAPTFLELLGSTIPDLDGEPIFEILE